MAPLGPQAEIADIDIIPAIFVHLTVHVDDVGTAISRNYQAPHGHHAVNSVVWVTEFGPGRIIRIVIDTEHAGTWESRLVEEVVVSDNGPVDHEYLHTAHIYVIAQPWSSQRGYTIDWTFIDWEVQIWAGAHFIERL